jgi:hypothetical protein
MNRKWLVTALPLAALVVASCSDMPTEGVGGLAAPSGFSASHNPTLTDVIVYGNVYGDRATNPNTGDIWAVNLGTSQATLVARITDTSSDFNSPNGLAFDAGTGLLYYAIKGTGIPTGSTRIFYVDVNEGPTQTPQVAYADAANDVYSGDIHDGYYYWVRNSQRSLNRLQIQPDGTLANPEVRCNNFAASNLRFGDIAARDGIMYISANMLMPNGEYVTHFFTVNLSTCATTVRRVSYDFMLQLAWAADGHLYGHETLTGKYYRVDPADGEVTEVRGAISAIGVGGTSFRLEFADLAPGFVPVVLEGSIGIVKKTNGTDNNDAPGLFVPVGSTVTWTYEVTNTGQLTLYDIAVTDDMLDSSAISCTGTPGGSNVIASLAPGASHTCTATGTATAGPYANIGTATGSDEYGVVHTADDPDHYFGQEQFVGRFCPAAGPIGGIDVGAISEYLFVFSDGRSDANWQSSSKGYVGNVAVNGLTAKLRTSGGIAYAGTIFTNAPTLPAWQNIVNNNQTQALASYNQTQRLTDLEAELKARMVEINELEVTPGFESRSATSLAGDYRERPETRFVINVTSGFGISAKINITGRADQVFILRWDTDANFSNGYQGQVKFQSGGAIVPMGGLTAANFIHVAGDVNASGGGSNPGAPYPQGPRLEDGQGALISGASNFSGGGFFTGYWLTTGKPTTRDAATGLWFGETSSLSNAIFVGGWYSITTKFSMTSGTSGVHVCPNAQTLRW